jgi:hypothetical protein
VVRGDRQPQRDLRANAEPGRDPFGRRQLVEVVEVDDGAERQDAFERRLGFVGAVEVDAFGRDAERDRLLPFELGDDLAPGTFVQEGLADPVEVVGLP